MKNNILVLNKNIINSRFLLTIYFLLFSSIGIYAQGGNQGFEDFGHSSFQAQKMVVPPSPNAAALGQFGEYSVSNYTGALNLSIPVYTLQGRSLSHSVSLSYNGSGSRVAGVPSWVGLGWNLNAGGVVTRSVRGRPDKYDNYFTQGEFQPLKITGVGACTNQILNLDTYDKILNEINTGYWDIKPDEYTLSVNGISSTFIMPPELPLKVIEKEKSGLTIEPILGGGDILSFKVTDQNGTIYTFDERESTFLGEALNDEGANTMILPEITYNSSWYLSSIRTPNTGERIEFTYNTLNINVGYEQPYNYDALSTITITPSTINTECGSTGSTSYGYSAETPLKVYNRRFLESISFKLGGVVMESLEFSSSSHTYNPGLTDENLNYIQLKDRGDNPKLSWLFTYLQTQCLETNRLVLSEFQEKGGTNSLSKPPYIFTYNSGSLPSFSSNAIDHWGYYNGKDNNSNLIPNVNLTGVNVPNAANREPSESYTKRGVLSTITYPTGGSTVFDFDLNVADNADGYEIDPGGLRVASATHFGSNNEFIDKKKYAYYGGVQFSKLQYHSETTNYNYNVCELGQGTPPTTCTSYTISGSSNISIQTIQGGHVGYSQVEEIMVDEYDNGTIGKTVHYYINPTQTSGSHQYFPNIEYGKVDRMIVKNQNGDDIKDVDYTYELSNVGSLHSIYGFEPAPCQSNRKRWCSYYDSLQILRYAIVFSHTNSLSGCANGVCTSGRLLPTEYDFSPSIQIRTKQHYLTNVNITESFVNSSISNSISKSVSYVYNDDNVTSPTEMTLSGPGVNLTTRVRYASEFPQFDLADEHMYATIIETKKYNNGGSFIGGTFVEYDNTVGNTFRLNPRKFRHILSDNSEYVMAEVLGYNSSGYPTGYQRYPTVNANFLHPETYTWENGNIKTITVDNQTQTFNYYPDWKQVEEINAADGTQTYYEYDDLQRLEITKSKFDHNSGTYQVESDNLYEYSPNKVTTTTNFIGDDTPTQTSYQTFDGIGRPMTTVVNGVLKEEVKYDDYGRVEYQTYLPGSFKQLIYQPNPLGRVEQEIYPDNSSISMIYDANIDGYKNTVIDENGHPSISVTDILGRTMNVEDALGNITSYHYDYKGNLRRVDPPNYADVGEAYEYDYDTRNRLIEKVIPGGATHTYQYNEADMMVGADNGNGMIVTIYDLFGRPEETGFGSFTAPNSYNITETLTETFYDDPNSSGLNAFPSNSKSNSNDCSITASVGKVVGTKVKILDTSNWIYTTTCYDQFGRSIVTNSNNHLDGNDQVTSTLNLADLPTSIERKHSIVDVSNVLDTEIFESFTYDGFLRNESTFHQIGDLPENEMTLNFNIYNDLDQLEFKKIGAHASAGIDFLQDIDYKYNSRGWLTHINEIESTPGEEAIDACNIVEDCPPECSYSTTLNYDSVNYITDITYIKWNIPFSIPLDYPYIIGDNFSSSYLELTRLHTDLTAWLNAEAYPASSITFIDLGYGVKININQTKTEFVKIYTSAQPSHHDFVADITGTLWEQDCSSPPISCDECYEIYKMCPCPLMFTEITPTKIKVEYDHPALTGSDIKPSLVRITETGIYTNMDGISYSADRTAVRAIRSINTNGELDAILATDSTYILTGDLTHMMEVDLTDNFAADFTGFKSQVDSMLASEINSAGISLLASAEMKATIMEATAETWYEVLLKIPSASGNTSANNPSLFAMELVYGNVHEMVDALPQHNGNISGMIWKTAGRTTQSYSFLYDEINRLTNGLHQEDTGEDDYVQNNYNVELTYDNMGNIQTLFRNGVIDRGICPEDPTMSGYTFGRMDSLVYSYRDKATGNLTNRLLRVDEFANTDYGYKGSGDGYEYDGNGNIKRDHNKGVTIVYNHLNLPKLFTFDAGGTITITYDAAGIKLKKEVQIQGGDNYTLHYIGGIEYREETSIEIESIHHAEGRVTYDDNDEAVYEYHLKDHLGNVRIVFADKDGDGYIEPFNVNPNEPNTGDDGLAWDLTDTEILQESHYYPFGMAMDGAWQDIVNNPKNNYLYNGKELNADFDLNWSDYGARWYDPAIARWNAVDPLAESMASWSPYNYSFNSPIRFIDPDGRAPVGIGDPPTEDTDNNIELINVALIQKGGSLAEADYKQFSKTKITTLQVDNTVDAINQLETLLGDDKKIGNLFVSSHGDSKEAYFSIGNQDYFTPSGTKNAKNLKKLGNMVDSEGQIILLSCHCGSEINGGEELAKAVASNTERDVIASRSWTGGNFESSLGGLIKHPSDQSASRPKEEVPYNNRYSRYAHDNVGKWIRVTPQGAVSEFKSLKVNWDGSLK